jgi:RimJ/RimL family protein N-acetyltransferase
VRCALGEGPTVEHHAAADLPDRVRAAAAAAVHGRRLDAVLDLHSHPEVARYLTWEPYNAAAARRALELRRSCAALEDEGGSLNLAAVLRDGGILVGDAVLLWRSREHRAGEVGFIFHPDHGGRGLATEATEEMLRLGFERLGLHRIIGRCDRRNAGSARLMERLGMRREARFVRTQVIKGEWADELVYALLEEEWQRAHRPEHGPPRQ